MVGLGGLGHMGLKFAHSFGAHVVQFTTSESKIADAKKLGADEVVHQQGCRCDGETCGQLRLHSRLRRGSARHECIPEAAAAERDSVFGWPARDSACRSLLSPILGNRRSLAGSMIGGMNETQEMLDYCAEHGIVSDIELTSIDKLAEAYERVVKGDVKYRFVIDMATLPKD